MVAYWDQSWWTGPSQLPTSTGAKRGGHDKTLDGTKSTRSNQDTVWWAVAVGEFLNISMKKEDTLKLCKNLPRWKRKPSERKTALQTTEILKLLLTVETIRKGKFLKKVNPYVENWANLISVGSLQQTVKALLTIFAYSLRSVTEVKQNKNP
jgi:hypothetical protein